MKAFETKPAFVLNQYKEENLPRQIHKFNRTVYRIKGIPKIILMILLIQNFNPTDRKTK
jgi:hypothetical protein